MFENVVSCVRVRKAVVIKKILIANRGEIACRVIKTARKMGIESPLNPFPSLALGAAEVSPLEMARAFGGLAAGGDATEDAYGHVDFGHGINRVFMRHGLGRIDWGHMDHTQAPWNEVLVRKKQSN